MTLEAPFPWFGGKRDVAARVWSALGAPAHYVEPFFGSGAVLLNRTTPPKVETVNDIDGLLANFWRAVRGDPEAVAEHADNPVNEADLHARHLWLVGERERLTERLMGDPDWFDPRAAGWWVWGTCNWIAGGFCSGDGPWISVDGVLTDRRKLDEPGEEIGVTRGLPRMSEGAGINRGLPALTAPVGINRKLPLLANSGTGIQREADYARRDFIEDWFARLAARLRETRVACGSWERILGPSVLATGGGATGIFFDPPYVLGERAKVYACDNDVAGDVLQWCLDHGDDRALRIVLAGYAGEHDVLESKGWRVVPWKARGGYGNQGEGRGRENAARERLWMSPHCVGAKPDLFEGLAA